MALINCKECNKEYSDTTTVCPHCGYERKLSAKEDYEQMPMITLVSSAFITGMIAMAASYGYGHPLAYIMFTIFILAFGSAMIFFSVERKMLFLLFFFVGHLFGTGIYWNMITKMKDPIQKQSQVHNYIEPITFSLGRVLIEGNFLDYSKKYIEEKRATYQSGENKIARVEGIKLAKVILEKAHKKYSKDWKKEKGSGAGSCVGMRHIDIGIRQTYMSMNIKAKDVADNTCGEIIERGYLLKEELDILKNPSQVKSVKEMISDTTASVENFFTDSTNKVKKIFSDLDGK